MRRLRRQQLDPQPTGETVHPVVRLDRQAQAGHPALGPDHHRRPDHQQHGRCQDAGDPGDLRRQEPGAVVDLAQDRPPVEHHLLSPHLVHHLIPLSVRPAGLPFALPRAAHDRRLRGRRFEFDPAIAREKDLDPRVRVVGIDAIDALILEIGPLRVPGDHPRRDPLGAQHHRQRRRVIVAVSFARLGEKVFERIDAHRRRTDPLVVRDIGPQPAGQRLRLVVRRQQVPGDLVRQLGDSWAQVHRQLGVMGAHPGRIDLAGRPQRDVVGGRHRAARLIPLALIEHIARERVDNVDLIAIVLQDRDPRLAVGPLGQVRKVDRARTGQISGDRRREDLLLGVGRHFQRLVWVHIQDRVGRRRPPRAGIRVVTRAAPVAAAVGHHIQDRCRHDVPRPPQRQRLAVHVRVLTAVRFERREQLRPPILDPLPAAVERPAVFLQRPTRRHVRHQPRQRDRDQRDQKPDLQKISAGIPVIDHLFPAPGLLAHHIVRADDVEDGQKEIADHRRHHRLRSVIVGHRQQQHDPARYDHRPDPQFAKGVPRRLEPQQPEQHARLHDKDQPVPARIGRVGVQDHVGRFLQPGQLPCHQLWDLVVPGQGRGQHLPREIPDGKDPIDQRDQQRHPAGELALGKQKPRDDRQQRRRLQHPQPRHPIRPAHRHRRRHRQRGHQAEDQPSFLKAQSFTHRPPLPCTDRYDFRAVPGCSRGLTAIYATLGWDWQVHSQAGSAASNLL